MKSGSCGPNVVHCTQVNIIIIKGMDGSVHSLQPYSEISGLGNTYTFMCIHTCIHIYMCYKYCDDNSYYYHMYIRMHMCICIYI
jgi:hypothetical protein